MAVVSCYDFSVSAYPCLAKAYPAFFQAAMVVTDITFWHIYPSYEKSVVANNLKTLKAIVLILINSGLLTGDIDLLLYAINAVEIR